MKFVFILLITVFLFVSCDSSDDPQSQCYGHNDCLAEQYCDFSSDDYDASGNKTGNCVDALECVNRDDCRIGFDCIGLYCKPFESEDIDKADSDNGINDIENDSDTADTDTPENEPDSDVSEEAAICGNGRTEEGEACDDGNNAGADYCSSDCKTVLGSCGDEKIQENEACDDGNISDGDYCSANCQLVTGRCGDGAAQSNEVCDDGNTDDNDYCSSDCKTESGDCGDGTVQSNEICDDGNTSDGDYCSSDCQTESGSCGDSYIQSTEGCDDGNSIETDYCSSTCTVIGSCGDGTVQSNEACDDGNTVDDETCSADCKDVPLKVEATSPSNGGTDVSTVSSIVITFNEPIDCNSAGNGGITINGIDVPSSVVACDDAAKNVTLNYPLEQSEDYVVIITTAVADKNGYTINEPYQFSFRTVNVVKNIAYLQNAITIYFAVPFNCDGDSETVGSIKKELTVKWDDDGSSSTGDVYINGTVTCNNLEKTATFTPASGSFDYYNKLHTVKINGTLLGTGIAGTILGQSGYTETYKIKRYFYDGFENGNSKWIFEDKSGSSKMTWAIGETTATGSYYPKAAYKGSNVMATGLNTFYNYSEISYANINAAFTGYSAKMKLQFTAFVHTESQNLDYLQIIAKDLNTDTEGALAISCIDKPSVTALNGIKIGYQGASFGYLNYQVDLSSMNGKDFGLKFLFRSDSSTQYPGIYIDEVQVVEEERIISQE